MSLSLHRRRWFLPPRDPLRSNPSKPSRPDRLPRFQHQSNQRLPWTSPRPQATEVAALLSCPALPYLKSLAGDRAPVSDRILAATASSRPRRTRGARALYSKAASFDRPRRSSNFRRSQPHATTSHQAGPVGPSPSRRQQDNQQMSLPTSAALFSFLVLLSVSSLSLFSAPVFVSQGTNTAMEAGACALHAMVFLFFRTVALSRPGMLCRRAMDGCNPSCRSGNTTFSCSPPTRSVPSLSPPLLPVVTYLTAMAAGLSASPIVPKAFGV